MSERGAGREWHLLLPAGTPLLSLNQRLHHMEVYARGQNLQTVTGWLARAAKMPRLERVHILGYVLAPDHRRRDPHNWTPTAKAMIDGLVRARLLPDDDWRHVTGPDMRLALGAKVTRFKMIVRELDGEVPGP